MLGGNCELVPGDDDNGDDCSDRNDNGDCSDGNKNGDDCNNYNDDNVDDENCETFWKT